MWGGSHEDSFVEVCEGGDLDIVEAVVDRTKVDIGVSRGYIDRTPLHFCMRHVARVISLWCTTCTSSGPRRKQGMWMTGHHFSGRSQRSPACGEVPVRAGG